MAENEGNEVEGKEVEERRFKTVNELIAFVESLAQQIEELKNANVPGEGEGEGEGEGTDEGEPSKAQELDELEKFFDEY